jgi:hypothetical protein
MKDSRISNKPVQSEENGRTADGALHTAPENLCIESPESSTFPLRAMSPNLIHDT